MCFFYDNFFYPVMMVGRGGTGSQYQVSYYIDRYHVFGYLSVWRFWEPLGWAMMAVFSRVLHWFLCLAFVRENGWLTMIATRTNVRVYVRTYVCTLLAERQVRDKKSHN